MSVPDNYEIIQTTSTDAQIRVDIAWEYDSITELYIWQQDADTGVITYYNLGDFAVVEKSDGSGDYIEVENVSTSTALVNTARRSPLTQTYDLANSEALDPVALIEALDKAVKILQEQDALTGTPDRQAITSVNPFEYPDKQTRKLTYVSFDENGDLRLDDEIDKIVGWSKEWAINPEDDLVSTEAGGNGVDDYSSLHHSRKSEGFSDDSESSANDSASSANDSANSATASANSATASANSASASATSAGNALASENKANLWAEEDKDVEVETGEYSAYHWAQKALENAGGGILFTDYYDGFKTSGVHELYTSDIDDIRKNARWLVNTDTATGDHPPFSSTSNKFYFLDHMQFSNNDNGIQMAYSMNAGDGEIFYRRLSVTWGSWLQIALADDFVPLAGNVGNPMTGNLEGALGVKIEGFSSIELGVESVNASRFVDFRSSSDPSQSDYSARIIRNSGVNGTFQIFNRGTGEFDIDTGGDIKLDAGSGLINCDNNIIRNLADPVASQDAVNLRTLEAQLLGLKLHAYAYFNQSSGTVVIYDESGFSSIVRNSEGFTTFTFDTATANTEYLMCLSNSRVGAGNGRILNNNDVNTPRTVNTFQLACKNDSGVSKDPHNASVFVYVKA